MQTIVIGHRNPDMDSACSAVAYAALKRALDPKGQYVAACAGNLNERVRFAFNRFAAPTPTLLTDVSPQVRDVMSTPAVSVEADSTVAQAIGSIEENRLRSLPVVDARQRCLGLLNTFKVSQHLFPPRSEVANARVVRAALADVVRTFEGVVVTGGCDGEVKEHVLMVAAMKVETFARRLEAQSPGQVVIFVGDRDDVQAHAVEQGVRAIVATGGVPITEEIRLAAAKAGVTLVRSRHDTATTVLQARGAVRVNSMLEREFTSFAPDTSLEAARARAADSPAPAFPILDADQRLVGVLSKSDFLRPVPRQLILVDHNELTQAVAGADKLAIVEVIDHHRLGMFSTETPIHFWNNPVGSTCTIVALLYEQHGVPIPPATAGLLLAGLISDTLNLTSPTATRVDREVVPRLEKLAGVKAGDLAAEIFAVGSPLLTLPPKDVVTADCKEYQEAGVAFSVSQIEELSFGPFLERKEEIVAALEAFRAERGLRFSALLVTDVNTQNSLLLLRGEEALQAVVDYPGAGPGTWQLDGVVSRKKQLLPYLLQKVKEVRR